MCGLLVFLDPKGYGDRKAVLVVRQSLDDDPKEAMIGEHGGGDNPPGVAPGEGRDDEGRPVSLRGHPSPGSKRSVSESKKHGDSIAIFVSFEGEPIHQLSPPVELHFEEPFYVGIGFCSHVPATLDSAVLSNVVLRNSAGKMQ